MAETKTLHKLDLRRAGASIALQKSMQTWTHRANPKATGDDAFPSGRTRTSLEADVGYHVATGGPVATHKLAQRGEEGYMKVGEVHQDHSHHDHDAAHQKLDAEHQEDPLADVMKSQRKSVVTQEVRDLRKSKSMEWSQYVKRASVKLKTDVSTPSSIKELEDAFYAIAAAFDMDGDGMIDTEELIHIFNRCKLFDEFLTPTKIRDYFKSWAIGCNYAMGAQFTQDSLDDGLGFEEFESVLRWSADMKGAEFSQCATRVIRLSRKLCDGKSSDRRRLEAIFDAFSKQCEDRMSVYEFGALCKQLEVYQRGKFSTGDVYFIFAKTPGHTDEGVDFDGFMFLLAEVGRLLGIGEEVFPLFAAAVSKLDNDEHTIRRVKLRIKHAASNASAEGWRQFFRGCDTDNSGNMDWDEFLAMCREKLELTERDNHLKIMFERLDDDDSGELSIDELIEFIEK